MYVALRIMPVDKSHRTEYPRHKSKQTCSFWQHKSIVFTTPFLCCQQLPYLNTAFAASIGKSIQLEFRMANDSGHKSTIYLFQIWNFNRRFYTLCNNLSHRWFLQLNAKWPQEIPFYKCRPCSCFRQCVTHSSPRRHLLILMPSLIVRI